MFWEKFKLFYINFRVIINTIICLIILWVVTFVCQRYSVLTHLLNLSDAKFAVFGTLLGAIVGGVFTLIGTNFINKMQLKAQTEIKRKNLIYKPLYDELSKVQNDILIYNPYPFYFSLNNPQIDLPNQPKYSVWQRIKSDTRYLDTPKCLSMEIELLYKYINQYLQSTSGVSDVIKNILNEVLQQELNTQCSITNIGDVLSEEVLANKESTFFKHENGFLDPKVELTDEDKKRVIEIFYSECSKNEKIKEIRKCRDAWVVQQKKTIQLLVVLITTINKKYEG